MIILLEGPDGSGKTTLANKLMKTYGAVYHHCGSFIGENVYQKHREVVNLCQSKSDQIHIIDRLYPSEFVYGNLYRDGERYDTTNFGYSFDHEIIYCMPSIETYLANYKRDLEYEEFKTGQHALYQVYKAYINRNSSFTRTYNYETDPIPTISFS